MATGFIVWDSKNYKVLGGPFATSGAADSFRARCAKNNDSAHTAKSSKNQSAQYTTESVTIQ